MGEGKQMDTAVDEVEVGFGLGVVAVAVAVGPMEQRSYYKEHALGL